MLRLDELRAMLKGGLHLHGTISEHGGGALDATADLVVTPSCRKEMDRLLAALEAEGYPHVVVTRKGRVKFPGKRFHGAVVVSPGKANKS